VILLRGVAYHIDEIAPIERIPALAQDAQLLTAFREAGYQTYAHSALSLAEQAVSSAKKSLTAANLAPKDLDAIVIGTSEIVDQKRYPEFLSTQVLLALELVDVPVVGVTMAGCANYASCLRIARNMLVAEGLRNILVIETDQVRGAMERQLTFEGSAALIFGDGAASVVVSAVPDEDRGFFARLRKGPERAPSSSSSDLELIAMAQTIKPIDYSAASSNDIALNNLLGFRHVLDEVMARAETNPADFTQIFMANVNPQVVADNCEVLGLPPAVYVGNSSRTAHVWSCDNLINFADYSAREQAPAGALFLMLSWAESYFSAIVCRKR
jgi:3-oxoacyl-[acyl-carrier-protein] synthase III